MAAALEHVVKAGLQSGERVLPLITAAVDGNLRGLLPSLSVQIQPAIAAGSAAEAVEVLRVYSKAGYSDSSLALAAAVAVKRDVHFLSTPDLVGACVAFSKHKTRIPHFFDEIQKLDFSNFPAKSKLSLFEAFVHLRIEKKFPGRLLPKAEEFDDVSGLVRFSYANSLPVEANIPAVIEAVEKITSLSTTLLKPLEHIWLMQVRAFLRFCCRNDYEKLSKSARDKLRALDRVLPAIPTTAQTVLSKRASEALRKLRIAHDCNASIGPFRVDIKERDRKIIWELASKERFIASTTGAPDRIATSRFQERVLKAMGYKFVQLPYWHWQRITLKKSRIAYMKQARFQAVKDKREMRPRELTDQSIDPTTFDAEAAAFDYCGETFMKLEQLKRPWSWSRHRPGELPTILTL